MTTKIRSKVIGRTIVELWDRHNGEWVVLEITQPKTNATPEHAKVRKFSWMYFTEQDARDCYEEECRIIERSHVFMCCN